MFVRHRRGFWRVSRDQQLRNFDCDLSGPQRLKPARLGRGPSELAHEPAKPKRAGKRIDPSVKLIAAKT